MKKTTLCWATCLLLLGTMAFTVVRNVFDELDMAEKEARDYIFENFKDANLSFPYSKMIKSLATGKRAGVVKELGDYMRQYTQSPEFLTAYKEARESARPVPPADKTARLKARLEELKETIASTEKDMKGAADNMKKLYEFTLTQLKEEQKALQDPKDPKHRQYMENLGDMEEDNGQNYEEAMKEYAKRYPANAKDLIKSRLKEFLAFTADIDFNAQLIDKGGKKRFVDPKLEAKDETWKRCFRCGRETITAARTYAQQWLKELN